MMETKPRTPIRSSISQTSFLNFLISSTSVSTQLKSEYNQPYRDTPSPGPGRVENRTHPFSLAAVASTAFRAPAQGKDGKKENRQYIGNNTQSDLTLSAQF